MLEDDNRMRSVKHGRNGLLSIFTLLFIVLLGSCCPEDPFLPTPPDVVIDSTRQSYLRLVVADFDLQPVHSRLDGEQIFCAPLAAFDYPEEIYEAQYWPVDTSASLLSFSDLGGNTLASTPIELTKGRYQTAYLYRLEGGGHGIIVTEDLPFAKPGLSTNRFRVVNFAKDAPPVNVLFQNNNNPADTLLITNLGYGDTTAYLDQSIGAPPEGKSLTVTSSITGDTIITIPRLLFFGDAVNTLVMVGRIRATGDDKFFFFNVLQDFRSTTVPPTSCDQAVQLLGGRPLYGTIPIKLEISALRFFNAVSSGSTLLDLALRSEQFGDPFPDKFRRNFPGQDGAVIDVAPLGSGDPRSDRGYFFLSPLLEQDYPFRVEEHIGPPWDPGIIQPVLVGRKDLTLEGGQRYTVIAFGPKVPGSAGSVYLVDRAPSPPPGMAGFRFFHGAHGPLAVAGLRLRANGVVGPTSSYGEQIDPMTGSFNASASAGSTLEVLDSDDQVVASASNVAIDADQTYLVILSRGPNGDELVLTAHDDSIVD